MPTCPAVPQILALLARDEHAYPVVPVTSILEYANFGPILASILEVTRKCKNRYFLQETILHEISEYTHGKSIVSFRRDVTTQKVFLSQGVITPFNPNELAFAFFIKCQRNLFGLPGVQLTLLKIYLR